MKRGILVATLLMTAAGVASANLMATSPHRVASPVPQAQRTSAPSQIVPAAVITGSSTDSGRPAQSVAAPTPTSAPANVASVHNAQKSVDEAHQAPVPFKLKPRPPVNLPPVSDKTADKAPESTPTDKPADNSTGPAADTSGENAARAAIEADGYKGVKVLSKGANGMWRASALRGKTTVMLTVDASGSVTAD